MGNRKAPSPAPGTPGYRGPRQVKPEPPPAPPPKRVSTFQHDEPVLRYQAHIDIPPDPPSAFPDNREIREGDSRPEPPDNSKDFGVETRRRLDAPRPGQSRYRLASDGLDFRVEEWRRAWLIGPYRWLPVSCDGPRSYIEARLAQLRAEEATGQQPSWQPVED